MRTRSLPIAAIAAGTLLLSACGSSPLEGKTGQEVTGAAADALEEAGAVHLTGTMEEGGEEAEIDVQLQGEDAAGTLTFGGQEIELIVVDGNQYIRSGADFWASGGVPEEAAAQLDGQWVALPTEASEFGEFSLAGIVEELRNPSSEVQEDVTEDELDGEAVVVVEQEDGSRLYVADDEPSYPLQLVDAGGQDGTLTLSGFGNEEDISAPEDAIDLADLGA